MLCEIFISLLQYKINTKMKSIKHQIVLILVLISSQIFAQNKETTQWRFGRNAGIDFNTNPPTAVTDCALNTGEGSASIADSTGNLLFYTDGITVFNASNDTMVNGTGLLGHESTTQSALIVKLPGSNTLYYIFTMCSFGGTLSGFNYSIADMSLNAGLGEIITKNVLVFTNTLERLTAVQHANGYDYWILINTNNHPSPGEIWAYNFTNAGLNLTPVISNLPIINNIGYLRGNRQGNKLAVATYQTNFLGNGKFQVMNFDNSSGIASNLITLGSTSLAPFTIAYGVEFSPDGTKLYCTTMNAPYRVIQYNLATFTYQAIINSGIVLASNPVKAPCSWGYYYGALQLAPDGKIYCVTECDSFLNVINYPDSAGTACNYVARSFYLNGKINSSGLPNFYHVPISSAPTNNIDINSTTSFSVFPNPANELLNIRFTKKIASAKILISNILSERLIQQQGNNFNSLSIDVSRLPKGVYLITFITDQQTGYKEFVKN